MIQDFFRLQGVVKATVSCVFEDLKFKISEGSDQNCPESAQLAVSAKLIFSSGLIWEVLPPGGGYGCQGGLLFVVGAFGD